MRVGFTATLLLAFGFALAVDASAGTPNPPAIMTPGVLAVVPPSAALNVSALSEVTITFSEALDPLSLSDLSLMVVGEVHGPYQGFVSYSDFPGAKLVTFSSLTPFIAGERISVMATTRITSALGAPIVPYSWSFTVETAPGDLTFAEDSSYYAARLPFEIAASDVNRDGRGDFAIVHATTPASSLSVFTARGDGSVRYDRTTLVSLTPGPRGIHAGDITGDRYPDLAVTAALDSSIITFNNSGTGAFGDTLKFDTNLLAYNIHGADFDGDADMDLSVGNLQGNQILIAKNDDGAFPVFTTLLADSSPRNMEFYDFDRDGDRDLAAVNANGKVSVFKNLGGGLFGPDATYGVGLRSLSLNVNDLNGDGWLDIAVSNVQGGSISLLFNRGDGTFGDDSLVVVDSINVGPGKNTLFDVYGGDLDGDGDIDLATANWFTGKFFVLANDGAGRFDIAFVSDSVGVGLQNIVGADPDQDGDLDLVITNWATGKVRVFRNGVSSLSVTDAGPPPYAVSADRGGLIEAQFSASVAAASITPSSMSFVSKVRGALPFSYEYLASERRLRIDPALTLDPGEEVRVLLKSDIASIGGESLLPFGWSFLARVDQGSATFGQTETIPLQATATQIVQLDFNGDSYHDLAAVARTAGRLDVYLGTATGMMTSGPSILLGGDPNAIALADIDHDGRYEIAVTDAAQSTVRLISTADTALVEQGSVSTDGIPHGLVVGDLNNDGWDDLMVMATSPFGLEPLVNSGGSLAAWPSLPLPARPRDAVLFDSDLDGDLDIATVRGNFGVVDLYENNGAASFVTNGVFFAGGLSPQDLDAGDLTGDGYPDLVIANQQSAGFTLLLSLGGGALALAPPLPSAVAPARALVADFNGDGILDIATASTDDFAVAVFFGLGGAAFAADSVFSLPFAPGTILSGDFALNGRLDIVAAGAAEPTLAILSNDPATGVASPDAISAGFLLAPRPNPARSGARVSYRLSREEASTVRVYNVHGELVRTLVDGVQTVGPHVVEWDARAENGRRVSPGVYFFRLETGGTSSTRKLTVIR
ncbi:MAG: FG-GAP-like repeat-containing protein [bacterium]